MKTFLISLLQSDFNTHYQAEESGKSFRELYQTLNQISYAFTRLSTEKEVQHRYLEMLIEHVRVSIISIDAEGNIHLANQAVKDMLRRNVLVNLKSIGLIDPTLAQTIRDVRTGETRLVNVRLENDLLQLSMHASEFKLEGKYYKLISMQDIRNELDAKEMESWQKLIRVLSHEIMNSVAPIISLSGTLHTLVHQNEELLANAAQYKTLDAGLEAIKTRSEGLYHFTQSYRKLTTIPKVSLTRTHVHQLVERVFILMAAKLRERNISFEHSVDKNLWIEADQELLEHVFINLITNAMDALQGNAAGLITIRAAQTRDETFIYVADNGEGIDDSIADKIFVPFFTTRKQGTGIGLALTKQILQLHGADISFTTSKGNGTEFILVFNSDRE
jgi:two-component system, NtrC family, nitrogen regulation sensor histidine kinase NtrY